MAKWLESNGQSGAHENAIAACGEKRIGFLETYMTFMARQKDKTRATSVGEVFENIEIIGYRWRSSGNLERRPCPVTGDDNEGAER